MSNAAGTFFSLDDSFVRDLDGLFVAWQAATVPRPTLLAFNEQLATELGLDADTLQTADGVAVLVGNTVVAGSSPIAQAYAGHQFGGYSPRLGDGRAVLLGEIHDVHGQRRDVHLKGSGRTPFARGGDGKAAVGPMLREYVMGEAMHALGIPTTRALAVVATGEQIARDTMLPGAVLTRVAASHLRVGTFQYAAHHDDPTLVRRLADYAIERHYPAAAHAANPYLAFIQYVADAQAALVARWMLVGFIHGVMNTDNMTISGETIDYGPCAFMDAYDPATVFSSIDHGGRYAYGNQPNIAQWNLARLAETLLPLIHPDDATAIALATEVLRSFTKRFHDCWTDGMRAKLGLVEAHDGDAELMNDLLTLLQTHHVDHTSLFRALASLLRGDSARVDELFTDRLAFDTWAARWHHRLATAAHEPGDTADAMDAANPVYIPRNHKVEEALSAATAGNMTPFDQLLEVLAEPFTLRPGLESYAAPAPPTDTEYHTFCGT